MKRGLLNSGEPWIVTGKVRVEDSEVRGCLNRREERTISKLQKISVVEHFNIYRRTIISCPFISLNLNIARHFVIDYYINTNIYIE